MIPLARNKFPSSIVATSRLLVLTQSQYLHPFINFQTITMMIMYRIGRKVTRTSTNNKKINIVLVAFGFFQERRFLIFSKRLTMNSFTNRSTLTPSISWVIFPCCFFSKLYFDSSFSLSYCLIFQRILMQGSSLKKGCSFKIMKCLISGWMYFKKVSEKYIKNTSPKKQK